MRNTNDSPHIEAKSLTAVLVSALLWITLSVMPFFSPWPGVPTKQHGLIAGALAAIVIAFGVGYLNATSAFLHASRSAKIALAGAIVWVAWQWLVTATGPSSAVYEALWGMTTRGGGLFVRTSILAICIVCALHQNFADGAWMLRTLRIASIGVAIVSTFEATGHAIIGWDHDRAYNSVFGNINHASSYYAFSVAVLTTWLAARLRSGERSRVAVCDAVLVAWLTWLTVRTAVEASSRQGVFLLASALAVGALVYGLSRTAVATRVATATVLAVGAGVAIYTVVVDNGAQDRIALWSTTINMAAHNAWRGVGVSQIPEYWGAYVTRMDAATGNLFRNVDEVHNGPLQQAAELGVVGFIAYTTFIVGVLVSSVRLMRRPSPVQLAAAAGFLVFALQDLFSPYSPVITLWGWVCAGIILGSMTASTGGQLYVERPPPRWAVGVVAAIAAAVYTWQAVPRIVTEVRFAVVYNTGRLNTGTESRARGYEQRRRAITNLAAIATDRPLDTDMQFEVAQLAVKNQMLELAERVLQATLELQPMAPRPRHLLAEVKTAKQDYRGALQEFSVAARQLPRSIWMALLELVMARHVRDAVVAEKAQSHVDQLGADFGISVDSMKVLQKRVAEGLAAVELSNR